MNVASTSIASTSTTETTSSSSSSSASNKDSSTSFKDELESVKTQESKEAETKTAEEQTSQADAKTEKEAQNTKNTQENNSKQATKEEQLKSEKEAVNQENENLEVMNSLKELNSKIATINGIKSDKNSKIDGVNSKSTESDTKNADFCQVIKMDSQDTTFFLNLVQKQEMTAQTSQNLNQGLDSAVNFTDVKTEATQKNVQVSQTLLNSLNDSMKTNKPFRIDFDSDISVIMKVDKDGVLSATFIPGSYAVENYLRNNIAGLRQTFDDQNLQYNELSYSNQKRENQQKEQQKNNKENKDE